MSHLSSSETRARTRSQSARSTRAATTAAETTAAAAEAGAGAGGEGEAVSKQQQQQRQQRPIQSVSETEPPQQEGRVRRRRSDKAIGVSVEEAKGTAAAAAAAAGSVSSSSSSDERPSRKKRAIAAAQTAAKGETETMLAPPLVVSPIGDEEAGAGARERDDTFRVHPRSPPRDEETANLLSPKQIQQQQQQQQKRAEGARKNLLHRLLFYLQAWWALYLLRLETHPVFTKSMSAAVLSVISDILAQYLSGSLSTKGGIDFFSLRNQFLIGFFFRGIPVHYWYLFLSRIFRRYDRSQPHEKTDDSTISSGGSINAPEGSDVQKKRKQIEPLWVTICKMLLDQLTFGPLNFYFYFYQIGWLEGRTLSSIQANIARDYWPVMLRNWMIWPIVQVVNFRFVPPALQVVFGNIIGVAWTAYVCLATRVDNQTVTAGSSDSSVQKLQSQVNADADRPHLLS